MYKYTGKRGSNLKTSSFYVKLGGGKKGGENERGTNVLSRPCPGWPKEMGA